MKLILLVTATLLVAGCTDPSPQKTVRRAQARIRAGEHKQACSSLMALNVKKIGGWDSATIYNYLRLRALCAHRSGEGHPSLSLASPYREYFMAMLEVGAGKSLNRSQAILKKALAAHPSHAELYYRLGLFYLLDERFKEACPLIKKAVELGRSSTDSFRISLARCRLGEGRIAEIPRILAPLVYDGVSRATVQQAKKIMEQGRLFKRLMPIKVRTTVVIVRSFLAKGNGGKALDLLKERVRENPQYPLLHYLLAVVHLRLGNKADTVTELRRCLKLDSTDPDAWFLLAKLYFSSAHAELVEPYLKKALTYNPFSSKSRRLLRNYYAKLGRYGKAADLQSTIIWLAGKKRSMNETQTLGKLLEKAERYNEALRVWGMVLKKLGPDAGIDAIKSLARIHLALSLRGGERTIYHRKQAARLVKLGLKLRPMDTSLVSLGKQLGVKHEVAKSPFESKVRVRGAKQVNKKDTLYE